MTVQIETATIIGTITGDGNAVITVTAVGMTNSPKAINVAVVSGDVAADVALKVRQTLALDADVQAFFLVSGATDKIILTARAEATNDATMNIASANLTCTGLTAAPTSANTQAGALTITHGYATIADYKAWITARGGTISTDAGDDSVIASLIEASSRYFDRETGRRFFTNSSDEVRYYTADDGFKLSIDDFVSVSDLAIDISGLRSYVTLPVTSYDLMPYNAALDLLPYSEIHIVIPVSGYAFPGTQKGVRVTGVFGWPVCPSDVKDAVLSICQNVYATRSGQSASGKVTVTAAGVVIRPEDVPALAQRIINSYRKMT